MQRKAWKEHEGTWEYVEHDAVARIYCRLIASRRKVLTLFFESDDALTFVGQHAGFSA